MERERERERARYHQLSRQLIELLELETQKLSEACCFQREREAGAANGGGERLSLIHI